MGVRHAFGIPQGAPPHSSPPSSFSNAETNKCLHALGKPQFLRALTSRGQKFVGEIPKGFVAWIKPPRVTMRPPHRKGPGARPKVPRLVAGAAKPQTVERLAKSHPALAAQPWKTWRIKDTEKGPLVWRVKHVLVYVKDTPLLRFVAARWAFHCRHNHPL